MTSKAAQAGFAILKDDWFEGPMDSMDKPANFGMTNVGANMIRPGHLKAATYLYLGTLMGLLESDQDDYIRDNIPDINEAELDVAIKQAMDMLGSWVAKVTD